MLGDRTWIEIKSISPIFNCINGHLNCIHNPLMYCNESPICMHADQSSIDVVKSDMRVAPNDIDVVKYYMRVALNDIDVVKSCMRVAPNDIDVVNHDMRVAPNDIDVVNYNMNAAKRVMHDTRRVIDESRNYDIQDYSRLREFSRHPANFPFSLKLNIYTKYY